jgi:hypothetical protein
MRIAVLLAACLLLSHSLPAVVAADCPGGTLNCNKDRGPCMPNGIMSYNGTRVLAGVPRAPRFVPWFEMLKEWPRDKNHALENFRDIATRFHCRAVRLLVFPRDACNGDIGVEYPVPSPRDIANLRDVLDTARQAGLAVVLVPLPPNTYRGFKPDAIDDPANCAPFPPRDDRYCNDNRWRRIGPCAARNGATLAENHTRWLRALLEGVLGPDSVDPWGRPRVENVLWINILGDFAPVDPKQRKIETERAWWRLLWREFSLGYPYIPAEKKTYEVAAADANPRRTLRDGLKWVRRQLERDKLPAPHRTGIQLFVTRNWLNRGDRGRGYRSWTEAYRDIIDTAADELGGYDRLIVEQIGVSTCDCHAQNDGFEGEQSYQHALAALCEADPEIPVAVWVYQEVAPSPEFVRRTPCESCTVDGFGIYRYDGTLKRSWWLLPWHFGRCTSAAAPPTAPTAQNAMPPQSAGQPASPATRRPALGEMEPMTPVRRGG